SSVLIAKIAVEIGRILVATGILIGMGFLLGLEIKTSMLDLFVAVLLATVFSASLMWVFILLGLTLKTVQAVQGASALLLVPMQFGSSIFAPPSTMPRWLRGFTEYNPLSNLADATRNLINGGPVSHSLWMTLGWAVLITLVAGPLSVAKFRKKT